MNRNDLQCRAVWSDYEGSAECDGILRIRGGTFSMGVTFTPR